jgi:hypothetical protein
MQASLISSQWFTLDIVASAGTYIKVREREREMNVDMGTL